MPLGIAVNIVGSLSNEALGLPLFMDSVGTMLTAVILGPWLGALAGFLSNLIVGLIISPADIPFGVVNAVIGWVTGYVSRNRGFEDLLTPLIVTLILTILCPVIATPIAVYLFSGVTGGNMDPFHAILLESGYKIFSSAFLPRILANFTDKLLSAYLVMGVIRILPPEWKGMAAISKLAETRIFEKT